MIVDGTKIDLSNKAHVRFLANWLALRVYYDTPLLEEFRSGDAGPKLHQEIHTVLMQELSDGASLKVELL